MKLGLLVMTPGKQEGKVLEIKLPQFLIGRDPQCQLRPASPLISKRHCAIIQRDGKVFVRDFGSTNGTFVNEEPVQGERELHNDDQLKVGPIAFTVRIEVGTPVSTKTPAPATKPAAVKTPAPATKPPTKKDDTPAPATKNDGGDSGEDDIAAMLLSIEGDETSGGPLTSASIPDGSTVMELRLPAEPGQPGQPGETKPKEEKKDTGDTRAAAARILEKMYKRPRT